MVVAAPCLVVLTVPHAACVNQADHHCDPDALPAARKLAEAIEKESNGACTVTVSVCTVKRLTEGDCNRANQPKCKRWQDEALELTSRASVHVDVHSCNKNEIYMLTRPSEFQPGQRTAVQKLITDKSGNEIKAKQGSDANYMLMQSRCSNHVLLEFSNDARMNKSFIPAIAEAICEACKRTPPRQTAFADA